MRQLVIGVGVAVALVAPPAAAGATSAAPTAAESVAQTVTLRITAVSNHRPEHVSGDEVLARVEVPVGINPGDITVERNGVDVTGDFVAQDDGTLLGLVRGLRRGDNTLTASGGGQQASLDVNNSAITGPLFSGSQQTPFFCRTEAFGLGPAEMPDCHTDSTVFYRYRNEAGDTLPLDDPDAPPGDVEEASVNGETVPWVIRVERGTINRAIYEIASLHGGDQPDPLRDVEPWNGRLVYTFGGGCNVGFQQGNVRSVFDSGAIGKGYARANASLNNLSQNCNSVISAETALMVKEHFIETYGPAVHTIGAGGSGGAIQQYQIADNYPGILDGIRPGSSFPDHTSFVAPVDCLLINTFLEANNLDLPDEVLQAGSGYRNFGSCQRLAIGFGDALIASAGCNDAVPDDAVYSEDNPDGIKCTVPEQVVNILGRDPATGFARNSFDNVGIQYGLDGVNSGGLSPEQFVALNEGIGGFDVAGNFVGDRSAADPLALDRAYASGLVLDGGGGLATTPIIDSRHFDQDIQGLIHTSFWSLAIQDRLVEANGDAANQVLLEFGSRADQRDLNSSLEWMDQWLTNIDNDDRPIDQRTKVIDNKPGDLVDACYDRDGNKIAQQRTYPSSGECGELYPASANPRITAGSDVQRDILKCQRKPLDFADYEVDFTEDQQARLEATFPDGVCDWTKPGVEQQRPAGVWQDFSANQPGPACPASAGNPALVRLTYLNLLDRCPDAGGEQFWIDFLNDGGEPEGFALLTARSAEGRHQVVRDVYDRILERAPEPGGASYWSDRLNRGLRFDDFVGSVAASGEFWGQAGRDPSAFVDLAYRRILRRGAEPDGQAYWADRIADGEPRGVITDLLAASAEGASNEARTAHLVMLRRGPTGGELGPARSRYRDTGDRFELYARRAGVADYGPLADTNPAPPGR